MLTWASNSGLAHSTELSKFSGKSCTTFDLSPLWSILYVKRRPESDTLPWSEIKIWLAFTDLQMSKWSLNEHLVKQSVNMAGGTDLWMIPFECMYSSAFRMSYRMKAMAASGKPSLKWAWSRSLQEPATQKASQIKTEHMNHVRGGLEDLPNAIRGQTIHKKQSVTNVQWLPIRWGWFSERIICNSCCKNDTFLKIHQPKQCTRKM